MVGELLYRGVIESYDGLVLLYYRELDNSC